MCSLDFSAVDFPPGFAVFSAVSAEELAVQYLDGSHLSFLSPVRLQRLIKLVWIGKPFASESSWQRTNCTGN